MTIIFAAATLPVNPPGESPLTMEQLWKGLELKVREPKLFLPPVESTEILEDNENGVLRNMKFKPGNPKPSIQERVTHLAPVTPRAGAGMETFTGVSEEGNRVLNIVSQGASGAADDLWLTFTFEWNHPDIAAGSPEHIKQQAEYQQGAPKAIAATLASVRRLLAEGKL